MTGDDVEIRQSYFRKASDISDRLHLAVDGESMLVLAVDAPTANAVGLPDDVARALESGPAIQLPLVHPNIDPAWRPRWCGLNPAESTSSLILQQSIDHALGELESEALQRGGGRRIAGWLEISGDRDVAARHVARQMLRRRPGGRQTLLRLHDPAVLWALWPLLSPGQQAALLGPVDAWWLLDPLGELVCLRAAGPADRGDWSDALWAAVNRIGSLNELLRHWLPATDGIGPSELETVRRTAMAALARAEALGFTDHGDLALFARHAIDIHPEFDAHDKVRALMEQRAPDDHYSALAEALTDDDWREVGARET
jgi:hypothetical protein